MIFALTTTAGAQASTWYGAGSCSARGQYATCVASGNASHPSGIYVHVNTGVNQRITVLWSVVCWKGTGAGPHLRPRTSGAYIASRPHTFVMTVGPGRKITHMHWSSWGRSNAWGHGTLYVGGARWNRIGLPPSTSTETATSQCEPAITPVSTSAPEARPTTGDGPGLGTNGSRTGP